MGVRRLLAITLTVLLASALAPAPPAAATEPAATPVARVVCQPGTSLRNLGIVWSCQRLAGGTTWVATATAPGPSAGSIGVCTPGDSLQAGKVRLVCAKVGGTNRWTRAQGGGASPSASSYVQTRPARLPGRCSAGSRVTLEGVPIICTGKGSRRSWTAQTPVPQQKPQPTPTPTAPTTVPGMGKEACLNAWWDKEFAGTVPQLARRQDAELTERIWAACHRGYQQVMTAAERDTAYAGFFQQVGQLVADEVQRVSAATGLNPCKAAEAVLKPHYAPGYGLIGWDRSGFLPILYQQWQGGPMIGKIGGVEDDCADGSISLQLRRHYNGRHEGPYYPALGTPDATWPITEEEMSNSWVKGAVCMVWSPTFGNTAAGSPARVAGYTYTNMGDGVNMVAADNEVTKCEFMIAKAAGEPVVWKASSSATDLRDVPAAYAGVWHTMADGCSWTLQPAGGGPQVTWSPTDGPYVTVELRAGDRFATTCELHRSDWEHMIVAPDGMFPLASLAPGPRRPTTPGTCRYTVTDAGSLRNPPSAGSLTPYAGETVTFDTTGSGQVTKYLRAVGCGHWALV